MTLCTALTGALEVALWAFLAFCVSCIVVTWWYYTRPGALLADEGGLGWAVRQ